MSPSRHAGPMEWRAASQPGRRLPACKARPSVLFLILMAAFALLPRCVHLHPYATESGEPLMPPSAEHWFGTDDLGVDLFAQLSHGAALTLVLGLGTALLSGAIGSLLGILGGYFGGGPDAVLTAGIDLMMCVPELPLMIVLGAFLEPGLHSVVLAVSLVSWTHPARMTRSFTLRLANELHIVLSQAYGGNFMHVLRQHLLRPLSPLLTLNVIRIVNKAIMAEVSLAYLGLGDPLSKTWGMTLTRAMSYPDIYFLPYWKWWLTIPLALVLFTVSSLASLADDWERRAS